MKTAWDAAPLNERPAPTAEAAGCGAVVIRPAAPFAPPSPLQGEGRGGGQRGQEPAVLPLQTSAVKP